jgi:hypothetical protein
VDEVPRQSAELRPRHPVERRIQDVAVRQIRAVRQNQAVLQDLQGLQGRRRPSGYASDAWAVGRQGTVRVSKVRQGSVADSCRDRAKDGDRRSASLAEFQRPVQGCPFRVQLVAESEPCKPAGGQFVALPCVAQAVPVEPAVYCVSLV